MGIAKARTWTLAVAIALAATTTACSSHKAPKPTPQSICNNHFGDVRAAKADTVGGVTGGGPRPVPTGPAHLGTYDAASPVTLCLVRRNTAAFDAIAITPDSKTYTVWTQNVDRHFSALS